MVKENHEVNSISNLKENKQFVWFMLSQACAILMLILECVSLGLMFECATATPLINLN